MTLFGLEVAVESDIEVDGRNHDFINVDGESRRRNLVHLPIELLCHLVVVLLRLVLKSLVQLATETNYMVYKSIFQSQSNRLQIKYNLLVKCTLFRLYVLVQQHVQKVKLLLLKFLLVKRSQQNRVTSRKFVIIVNV